MPYGFEDIPIVKYFKVSCFKHLVLYNEIYIYKNVVVGVYQISR